MSVTQFRAPQYVGHKIVQALRIRSVEPMDGNRHRLTFQEEGATPLVTQPGWVDRHYAKAGGYYVTYEDGYVSWSPADAFEKGYTLLEDWGVTQGQEPKYMVNGAGRLTNRVTGIAIPDEEPVIIFRAKDALMPMVLSFYAEQLPPGAHKEAVLAQRERALRFQENFRGYVRIPD